MSTPLFVMLGSIVLRVDDVRYLATDSKDDTKLFVVFTDSKHLSVVCDTREEAEKAKGDFYAAVSAVKQKRS